MSSVSIEAGAIEGLAKYIDSFPAAAPRAARLAINQTVQRDGLKLARKAIYAEVAFPAGYLEQERLVPGRLASDGRLEASILGRERPTSLARFVRGPVALGRPKNPITVMVKPGRARVLPRAFFVPLRVGAARTETVYNLGLAVRLKPGEELQKSDAAVEIEPNVFLLYGPSVAQVFQTVAQDIAPEVAKICTAEFFRQFTRLTAIGL